MKKVVIYFIGYCPLTCLALSFKSVSIYKKDGPLVMLSQNWESELLLSKIYVVNRQWG